MKVFTNFSSLVTMVKHTKNTVDSLSNYVNIYALLISSIGVIVSTKKFIRLWRTRQLRKIWGIKDGDDVVVVCSELDDPTDRQNVEPREFIYNLKYGDVDAYFEVVVTLLRLYPNLKLRIMSSGEAESTRVNLAKHLVLIGGPDYNKISSRIIDNKLSRYLYRSPYCQTASISAPDEIVLYDWIDDKEYYETIEHKDYGYFERIKNPNNPQRSIILIGGCHTIGVTGAIKAFSLAESEDGEIPRIVLENSKTVAKIINKQKQFSVLVSVERLGQTINIPVVTSNKVKTHN